ncbi:MAG: hypothetical protein Q8Q65_03090, partial [bacterium]|nr:hypothetical protein [bacterium]
MSPYSILAEVNEESKAQEVLELERKLSETKSKKNTLSSQVEYLTNQIRLTTLNITNTEAKIDTLEESIEDLGDKIMRLDSSLDNISRLLLERIVASYKYSVQAQSAVDSPFYLLLSSNGFDELFRKSRQLSIVEEYDTNLLLAVESSKSGFEKQKELRELKQEQLAQLQDKYTDQKQVLGSQTAAKNQLLEVTKNDEKRYQELLAEAKKQLSALRRFVVSQGGASILSGQTKCDDWGCYYNQRDSEWGGMSLGNSGYSVAEYGCLASSISMIASHNGVSIKPNDIAVNESSFVPGTGYLYHSFTANGVNVALTSVSSSKLDEELSAGRPVIAGLYSG